MTLDTLKRIIREEGGDPAQGGSLRASRVWFWPSWAKVLTSTYFVFKFRTGALDVQQSPGFTVVAVKEEAEVREWTHKILREMVVHILGGKETI